MSKNAVHTLLPCKLTTENAYFHNLHHFFQLKQTAQQFLAVKLNFLFYFPSLKAKISTVRPTLVVWVCLLFRDTSNDSIKKLEVKVLGSNWFSWKLHSTEKSYWFKHLPKWHRATAHQQHHYELSLCHLLYRNNSSQIKKGTCKRII